MKLNLLFYIYAITAITSDISAKSPVRQDCMMENTYNPDTLPRLLKMCRHFVFGNLRIPAKLQFRLLDLFNITIKFEGNVTFAPRYNRIDMMHITGTNVRILASPDAWFIANGESYYDGGGYNNGKLKPFFAMIEVKNSTITDLKVLNTPAHAFMLAECYDSYFDNFQVDDAYGDDTKHRGKNTDGIHILQSQRITITNSKIHNQDDCACITSGVDVKISGFSCNGGGFSVGSMGGNTDNTVKRVSFSKSTLANGWYGCLIKAWPGRIAVVDHVTFEDIILRDVRQQGIAVTQGYTNAGLYSKAEKGVSITNVHFKNIGGHVLDTGQKMLLNCAKHECGKNTVVFENIDISGGKRTLMISSPPITLTN